MRDRDKLIELIRESFTEQMAEQIADHLIKNGVVLVNRTPLENVELSLRASNVLKRAGINTIEELRETDLSAIKRMRGVGKMTLEEILKVRNRGVKRGRKG